MHRPQQLCPERVYPDHRSGIADPARILLVGVPYALKAADADTLGGKPASAFVTNDSPAAAAIVPTSSPSPAPDVIPNVTPTGSGTTNYLPLWTSATNLGKVVFPDALAATHFLKLELTDAQGKLVSSNFYWRAQPGYPEILTDLNQLPMVALEAKLAVKDADGQRLVTVTLHNPTKSVALMAHLQLRRQHSGERVLPVFYSDNYISLVPGESRSVTIQADAKDFSGEEALVVVDGWNVTVAPASAEGVSIAPNLGAQPDHWPVTGLPFQTVGLR